MNKRLISIIKDILNTDSITIKKLSVKHIISERSVRNDLIKINDILRSKGVELLSINSTGEIVKSANFKNIKPYLKIDNLYEYKLSKDERKYILISMTIQTKDYITLNELSKYLLVSRVTVVKDLPNIKAFLTKYALELQSCNRGLFIYGDEIKKRELLLYIIIQCDNIQNKEKYLNISYRYMDILNKIIQEQQQIHDSYFTDDSIKYISTYLNIMIQRNMYGKYIKIPSNKNYNEKYYMAQDICKYISQYLGITIIEDEITYISSLLSNSRYTSNNTVDKQSIKIQLITRVFIETISEYLSVNLNNDYEFYESLSSHLSSIFNNNDTIEYGANDVANTIIENNKIVFEAIYSNIKILENYMKKDISSIQASYICIHTCAALERYKNKEAYIRVILVCNDGVATSKFIIAKLKKRFNFQVISYTSSHNLKKINIDDIDLIISTVDILEYYEDWIRISPILTKYEYNNISKKIDDIRTKKGFQYIVNRNNITSRLILDKISPIIRSYTNENTNIIINKIKDSLHSIFKDENKNETNIFSPNLHNLLTENHIDVDIDAKDWQDSIKKCSEILLKRNYIEKEYIDAMINNIYENGPYIVIAKGFAFPHAGLDEGSIKLGMSLIKLKEPVSFGNEKNDPVSFVCCLSCIDHKSHLKAFFNLVNMLRNTKFIEVLQKSRTKEDIARAIQIYEQKVYEILL